MKLLIKLLIVSVNVLLIDTLQRFDPVSEIKQDYRLRHSQPLIVENYEKY